MKLDEFHRHEALHTTSVLMDTWAEHICEHPFVAGNKEIASLAERAIDAMNEVYNAISRAKIVND